jgi:hypothetical protein
MGAPGEPCEGAALVGSLGGRPMQLYQSSGPGSTQSAIDDGRLDDAIGQIMKSVATSEDASTLAYLLCQRGDYELAVEILREERWGNALGSGGLRLRGNSLWRAGHLTEALHDLVAAGRMTTGQQEAEAIRADIALLEEETGVMRRVDRSLTRLEIACAITVGLILVAIIEVHRRVIARALPATTTV